jgi:hypothetical protein
VYMYSWLAVLSVSDRREARNALASLSKVRVRAQVWFETTQFPRAHRGRRFVR